MKKIILILVLLILISGCTKEIAEKPLEEPTEKPLQEQEQQRANSASVYCEEQGGKLEVRTNADGSQTGYCVAPDGAECEEWAFFRKECPKAPEPPAGEVSVYKGFWMPCAFLSDDCQPMSDVNLHKEIGSNIVLLGPNLKINSNGDAQFDVPMAYLEKRMNELANRFYKDGIRIGLVIETLYVRDFTETTPAGGPGAFPTTAVNKPGFLDNYNKMVEEIAQLAEKYHVEMFSPMNEPDLKLGEEACSKWGQEVLPLVKKHYHGKVLYKTAFYKLSDQGVDFKGYDIIGMDPSPGGGPTALSDYSKEMEQMLSKALDFAKRDKVSSVMYTEFGVWGGALSLSEEDKALAHRIIFEQGKGKVKGFIALDPPPDLDRSIKGTKTFEEIKLWFKEKLE